MQKDQLTTGQFVQRLLIALLLVGLAVLLWTLRSLVILIFGAILVAVILRVIANPIRQRLHLPDWLSLLVSVLILVGLFGIAFWLFGAEVAQQARNLQDTIPEAWEAVQARLESVGLAEPLREWLDSVRSGSGGVLNNLGGVVISVGNAITDTLLVIAGGIFFAVNPGLYRAGLLKLVPKSGRDNAAQALEDCSRALKLWLLGRLGAMAIVGILTGLGLWIIGIPAALTLGLVAGLLDFIPFVGPIIAAIPAVLLALAFDPTLALWTVGLYLLIQQIEGNVVTPLMQQQAVELPPALLLFALVACGLVFGIAGILFAEPLTVVVYVLVKRLYVRGALQTDTPIPGEDRR